MKKALPIFVVVLVGLVLGGGAVFGWKKLSQPPKEEGKALVEERVLKELSLDERPYTSLTPGPSCEYTLALQRIQGGPDKIEYEIVYKDEKGVTQGASGSLTPKGKTSVDKKVLFGTESSGHRKCDKGVEEGTITLRYRNPQGKLTAKLETKFNISEGGKTLESNKLKVNLSKTSTNKFVTMGTLGLPGDAPGKVTQDPVGIFTDGKSATEASIKMEGEGTLYGWNGSKWVEFASGKSSFLGTYVLVASQ